MKIQKSNPTIRLHYFCMIVATLFILNQKVYGASGDLGYFGGMTEGRKLPKTTETQIALQKSNTSKTKTTSLQMVYKEELFLSGAPVIFEGLLTVKPSRAIADDEQTGAYTVSYDIRPGDSTSKDALLNRSIVFDVNFRREGTQLIKDYSVKSWKESAVVNDQIFVLDPKQSRFGVSILEDHTAGVTYYKGNISERAVYTSGNETTGKTVLESEGDIYGYESAWSTTETHRINNTVSNNIWQMQYQIRPSVSVNKVLQYSKNEPTAISFSGNYKEVMQNESGLEYDIFIKPQQFYNVAASGSATIETFNDFEQLIAPDVNFLKGHFAEDDIRKLFSMQVLDGNPKNYVPNQAITRGQYITALAKAIKLAPIDMTATKKTSKNKTVTIVFPDVTEDRPEYPYIMAAYNAGLAVGRTNGYFYIDEPIQRDEAFAILLRTLGLENLGLDPTPMTPFADDDQIAPWAKQEIYAANRIGLIDGDENYEIHPKANLTKAEAAALLNRLVSYMRVEMKTDYTEHIVHYAN